ncbi:MAG: SGNH/GDSL hydrolase family protein [Oscillospiraceae bacterium]|nr:SGNH/GDSL hydrolase family protein [Oscillospiraceae bacterium]MBQ3879297.1 SGNH/GDSL hydrolase family protein [Oscillospiraceae bacterium]
MKNVLLLGDSIRMLYQPVVKEKLEGRANVYGPADNGRWSGYTLNSLRFWLPQLPTPDIVHWNNGLWDMGDDYNEGRHFYPPELYEETCRRMFKILRQITKNPDLPIIVATTTPVISDKPQDHVLYNEILCRVAKENGAPINDLYTAINEDLEGNIGFDHLHLSKKGVGIAADMVVKEIEKFL